MFDIFIKNKRSDIVLWWVFLWNGFASVGAKNMWYIQFFVVVLSLCFVCGEAKEVKERSRFSGYREWKDARDKMVFHDVRKDGKNHWKLTVEFSCPGATSYLLSQSHELNGGEWAKMSSPVIKKKLRVFVHNREELLILWVVFKRKSPQGTQFEISAPLGTARHKTHSHHKIQLIENGYIDWTSYQIFSTGKSDKLEISHSRYGLGTAQKEAQEAMSLGIQKIVRAMALDHINQVQNYFYEIFSSKKNRDFLDFFAIIPQHVYYPSKYEAVAIGEISLREEFPFFFRAAHESLPIPPKVSSVVEGPISRYKRIYVDVKGLFFSPCVFPEILSLDGKIICNRSLYEANTPYVRYLQGPDEVEDESYAYVKAKVVSTDSPSKIMIQQNSHITTADWEDVISRGELYFLID